MRRLPAILAICAVAALASGLLGYVHDTAHALRDGHATDHADHADHAEHGHDEHGGLGEHPAQPVHDETNCFVHAQLAQPMIGTGVVQLLVCLGLFVAFLTLLPDSLVSRRVPARLDCRGPPSVSSPSL